MLINKSDNKVSELDDKMGIALEKIPTELPLVPYSLTTRIRYSPLFRQCCASLGPILSTVGAGMVSGYSAVLLPQLQDNKSDIIINEEQASWIAALGALPMAIGCVLGGILMEKFGRKFTNLIICIPAVIGWATIGLASNVVCILIGRFITGVSSGLLGAPVSVYIGETSDPKYRGLFLAGVSLAIAIGILLSHLLGTFLHWKLTAILSALLPFAAYCILTCVPESPAWLLSKGKMEESEQSFKWLRGFDLEAATEFNNMVQKYLSAQNDKTTPQLSLKDRIFRAGFIKPLAIVMTLFFVMQFSGVNAVAFYSVSIMKETIGVGLNEYLAMFVVDIVRLVMSIVACILLRNAGRRPLVISSGIGTTISLIGLSTFLYLASKNVEYKSIAWIPLVCIIGYICFVSIGVVPVPWCLIGELFPVDLRGLGSGISSSWNFLILFTVVKTGPTFFKNLGPEGAFLIYGCVTFFGTIFSYFFVPETRNRTLQDIEESFCAQKKKDNLAPAV